MLRRTKISTQTVKNTLVEVSSQDFGTRISYGAEMQLGALMGARRLAKTVGATLGPGGRNVVIDPHSASNFNALSVYPKPVITKDGVSVARHLNLLDSKL